MERTNQWLEELLYELWEDHFNDVPRKNLVLIKFGRGARRQLGSIQWVRGRTRIKTLLRIKVDQQRFQDDKRITLITITSLFQQVLVPQYVVKATIAHEMIHYAHGFFSPLKQMYNHPHKGGLIRKEMDERGLGTLYKRSQKWLRERWYK